MFRGIKSSVYYLKYLSQSRLFLRAPTLRLLKFHACVILSLSLSLSRSLPLCLSLCPSLCPSLCLSLPVERISLESQRELS